ncbi:MAG: hypothetical protein ACKOSS_09595 [Planctomycetia bacterium]
MRDPRSLRAGRCRRAALPAWLAALLLALPAAGCATYRAERSLAPEAAVAEQPAPQGALSFEQALALLPSRNPELRALEAAAAGVNLAPNEAMLEAGVEAMGADVEHATLGTDLLSLLGVGTRPAQQALARAMREERLAMRLDVAREKVRALALAYARLAALDALVLQVEALDLAPYRRAGLAPEAAWLESAAARGGWEAERASVALERRRQQLEVLRLLGCSPTGAVQPLLPPAGWPACPPAGAQALLYARADLQRLAVAVQVADREARLMLARQWPTVGIELGPAFDPTDPFGVLMLRVPLGAPAEARAALRRRDAAALALESGVLAARHDAATQRLALEAAEAELRFREAWWTGKHAVAQAARERARIDSGELPMAAQMEAEELMAARDLRMARMACAEARVEAAVAAGWPGPSSAAGSPSTPRPGQMRGSG